MTVDLQKEEEHDEFDIQDPIGDGDPTTSDGIYVRHKDYWGFDVNVGDHVRIEATVSEWFGETQLGNVFASAATVCGTGSVGVTRVKSRDFNSSPEQYEGMLVEFKGTHFVTDTYDLYRFGQVWLGTDSVVEQPTDAYPGDSEPMYDLADDNMALSVMLISAVTDRDAVPEIPFAHGNGTLRWAIG